MSADGKKYLIDTDVLAHIRTRTDSDFIYSELVAMARAKRLQTVPQVFDELKRHGPCYRTLEPHKKAFLLSTEMQYCEEVQAKLELVGQHAGFLWEQVGGKNPDPADPWLVAVSAAYGYTLVTNESRWSPKRIPAACRHPSIGVLPMSGPEFLIGVGIVKEIDPSHIDPKAFFDTPGAGKPS